MPTPALSPEDLNVDAVLEGSVRSAGDTIRLTAQLVDGRTGFQLWSQTYERDFKDLFQLQDELTNAIVREVGEHFHADVPATVNVTPPTRTWRPTPSTCAPVPWPIRATSYVQGSCSGKR